MAEQNLQEFIRLLKNPVKFRLFLLKNLPSAYFSGVRIKSLDISSCSVIIPYKWFSTNPFRSTYFACLAMAAEMSTGALAMAYLYKRNPRLSMLVTNLEAEYLKKATGVTTFKCEDGEKFRQAIESAINSAEPQVVKAVSRGYNEAGEAVANFQITWSFKSRSRN